MAKCEYQHMEKWPSKNHNTDIHDQVCISTLGTWQTMNINMEIYDQALLSTLRFMNKCEYQHGDTVIHDQAKISKLGYMTERGYQYGDTWPSENINTEIQKQVWISTWE